MNQVPLEDETVPDEKMAELYAILDELDEKRRKEVIRYAKHLIESDDLAIKISKLPEEDQKKLDDLMEWLLTHPTWKDYVKRFFGIKK